VACTHSKGIAVTADGHQKHILVVNDTQEILDLMQELLEDEGYHVTTSLAFLDMGKLKTLAPDLIVQDLLFEQTQEQGWKFLTLVRLDPELARIPLILCTAAVQTVKEPEMAEQLDRLGVRVVLKPFLIEDLLTAIAGALTAQTLIDQATGVPASDGHGPAETLGETIGGDAVADDASER
jgi:CheY-like chemotaxis protein